jgi:hypothetical protein
MFNLKNLVKLRAKTKKLRAKTKKIRETPCQNSVKRRGKNKKYLVRITHPTLRGGLFNSIRAYYKVKNTVKTP